LDVCAGQVQDLFGAGPVDQQTTLDVFDVQSGMNGEGHVRVPSLMDERCARERATGSLQDTPSAARSAAKHGRRRGRFHAFPCGKVIRPTRRSWSRWYRGAHDDVRDGVPCPRPGARGAGTGWTVRGLNESSRTPVSHPATSSSTSGPEPG